MELAVVTRLLKDIDLSIDLHISQKRLTLINSELQVD